MCQISIAECWRLLNHLELDYFRCFRLQIFHFSRVSTESLIKSVIQVFILALDQLLLILLFDRIGLLLIELVLFLLFLSRDVLVVGFGFASSLFLHGFVCVLRLGVLVLGLFDFGFAVLMLLSLILDLFDLGRFPDINL